MPTRTVSRRRSTRHTVVLDESAFVEFEMPEVGQSYRRPLSDLSRSGLSFSFDPGEAPPIEEGTTVEGVSIHIRECIIEGELLVMHVTPRPDSRIMCGALLYPATDHDLLKLNAVLAGMEAVKQP